MPPSPTTSAGVAINYSAVFAGQTRALQILQQGGELKDVLSEIVKTLERAYGGKAVGGLLLVENSRLRHGAAPSLPDDYNRAIDGLEVGAYGTCAAAAYRNEVVMTRDIATDPGWTKIKHLPLGLKLMAAWSQPIRNAQGEVVGTLGTYFRECRIPSETEQEIVSLLATTAGLAIQRHARGAKSAA